MRYVMGYDKPIWYDIIGCGPENGWIYCIYPLVMVILIGDMMINKWI